MHKIDEAYIKQLVEDFLDCKKVFVYGSLKSGYWNNHLLIESKRIGEFVTEPIFNLANISEVGGYPVILDGFKRVRGEVYELDEIITLFRLDQLEGYPDFYDRKKMFIPELNEEVWYYHYTYPHPPYNITISEKDGVLEWSNKGIFNPELYME